MHLDENIIRSNRIEAAIENTEQTFQKSPAEPSPRNLFDIEIGFILCLGVLLQLHTHLHEITFIIFYFIDVGFILTPPTVFTYDPSRTHSIYQYALKPGIHPQILNSSKIETHSWQDTIFDSLRIDIVKYT